MGWRFVWTISFALAAATPAVAAPEPCMVLDRALKALSAEGWKPMMRGFDNKSGRPMIVMSREDEVLITELRNEELCALYRLRDVETPKKG